MRHFQVSTPDIFVGRYFTLSSVTSYGKMNYALPLGMTDYSSSVCSVIWQDSLPSQETCSWRYFIKLLIVDDLPLGRTFRFMTSVVKFVMSILSSFTPPYFRIGDTKFIHLDEQKICIRDVTLKL